MRLWRILPHEGLLLTLIEGMVEGNLLPRGQEKIT